MTFKVGDIVLTRDGREVEILKVDAPHGLRPILGMYCSSGVPDLWRENGRFFGLDEDGPSNKDLLPPKRTREVMVWVNVYSNGETEVCPDERNARDLAESTLHRAMKLEAIAVPATLTVGW